MDKKIFGLHRNVFFLGLTSFFNDFSAEMIVSIFPAFFTSVLKSGAASLGLVEGVADGIANVIKIYSGRMSDAIGRRKNFIVSGYALSVATRPFYLLCSSVAPVLGLRVLDRVGKGLREAPRDAIISLSVPKAEMGRSFGYHRTMDTLGGILGPLVAYMILRAYPNAFSSVFLTSFIIGIFAVFSLGFVKDIAQHVGRKNIQFETLKVFSRKFKIYLFSVFILALGTLPTAVLLLKTQDLGFVIASIPLYYAIYNIAYAAFSILAGKTSDSHGGARVIILGYAFLLLSYGLLYIAKTPLAFVGAFFVLGLFSAFTDGVQRAYAAQLTSEAHRGGAYGLLNAVSGFGAMVAGILGGYLWQVHGSGEALAVGGVAITLGLILFWVNAE